MGSLPKVAVLSGPRVSVPVAPLSKHLQQLGVSERTALMYSDETCNVRVSYAELEGRSNALARAVAAHARPQGPNEDGDFAIAMCMQPTHNTIITLLGICKAGGAYLPMEPTFPPARVAHILHDAQPSLVIYDETADPSMFAGSGVPAVSFEELSLEASALPADRLNEREVLMEQDASSVGLIYYTSGSTGVPKGVRMQYAAICNRLWWQFQNFPFADSETTCVWKTALTFVDSICEIWAPLLHGRTLLILSKEITRDPQKLVRVLDEHQIHRLVLVPTLLRSILMYLSLDPSNRPLQNLKLWVCSGETLSKGLAEEFFQYFGDRSGYRLANFYGSTEVMADVTYYVIEKMGQLDMFPTIPIGAPINNCAVYLLDEEMNLARQSEPGEIWVAGANLALGYVGGQAPEKFCDNPHAAHPGFGRLYRTGDFGILEKGVILYTGRTDSQVKIRGHRVDLQEVERAVSAVAGVSKAVVLCYGVASGNPEILAFVTIQPNARLAGHMIEAALTKMLINYMIPQVIVIDVVPLLVNGKVDRQALLKMYENTNNNDDPSILLDIDYTGVEPGQMEAARVLFETVGEVLGRSARGAVCVSANFYELGGNSLNSIYTITKLRDRGFFIEITDFLNASNLGEILSSIKTNPDEVEDEDEQRFKVEPMKDEHKERVFEMIVTSFYEKAELEQCLINEIKKSDYAICLEACWAPLLTAGLSRVLTDASGTPVAVALNFDARDEPEVDLPGGLGKIMAFLEHVEGSVRDTMLPEGKGTVLHAFMMATAADLSPRDNVLAIRALEMATEQVARDRHYLGVFTTNTSPLTQQLGQDVLGYQTLVDCQINQYVDCQGVRVFAQAPDDMHALVCWKPVQSH